jgi:hypothetical protein
VILSHQDTPNYGGSADKCKSEFKIGTERRVRFAAANYSENR